MAKKKENYPLERLPQKRTVVDMRTSISKRLEQIDKSRLWLAEQIDERPATIYEFLSGKKSIRSDKLEKMLTVLGLEIRVKE